MKDDLLGVMETTSSPAELPRYNVLNHPINALVEGTVVECDNAGLRELMLGGSQFEQPVVVRAKYFDGLGMRAEADSLHTALTLLGNRRLPTYHAQGDGEHPTIQMKALDLLRIVEAASSSADLPL